jgi:hypothetical protein
VRLAGIDTPEKRQAFGQVAKDHLSSLSDSTSIPASISSRLETVGKPSDLVLSHPPYHDCVVYSGSVWGTAPHPDDLSRCATEDEFMNKLNIALLNQRSAAAIGGHYGLIIGDVRRGGRYFSPQAEIIARMPRDELPSVLIKAQHNMVSNSVRYAPMKFPKITHEYVVLWQRP